MTSFEQAQSAKARVKLALARLGQQASVGVGKHQDDFTVVVLGNLTNDAADAIQADAGDVLVVVQRAERPHALGK